MNHPSAEHSFPRHTILTEMLTTLRAQPADIKYTAQRFSLVRPAQQEVGRDILLKTFRGLLSSQVQAPEQRRRLLVTEYSSADLAIYNQLAKARIPQATLLANSEHLAFFDVINGSKLLSHEPLNDRQSTPTYISDGEIFNNVGRLYGAAWRATGRLLVSEDPADRISDHIAIVNFSEAETSNIYLCPPFADSREIADSEAASRAFAAVMRAEDLSQGGTLTAAAVEGFDDVMRHGWR